MLFKFIPAGKDTPALDFTLLMDECIQLQPKLKVLLFAFDEAIELVNTNLVSPMRIALRTLGGTEYERG